MYKSTAIFLIALLFANPTLATFELEDPAAEFAKDTPEANAEMLASMSCHDFLLQGAGKSDKYDKALVRVYRYYQESQPGGESPPTEAGLKAFCIDHPKNSLKDAADAQINERL